MKSKIKSMAGILKAVTLILAALLLTEAGLKAQPVQLTLKEAINQALQANQDVRKARLDEENSRYKVDEVRGTALPQISGTGSLTYNPILQLSALPGDLAGQPGQTILVAFGQKWNAGAGVQLNQSLFDKSIFTGLKAARSTEEFYKLNTQLSEEQIIEMVANSYYQLQVQKQRLYVLDSNYNSTSRVRKVLQGQYDNGLARKIDVDRISVSISNIEAQRQQLRNTIKQAENQVKFLVGFPIQSAITIPDVVLKDIHPEVTDQTDSLILDERTEVMVLKKQTDPQMFYRYSSVLMAHVAIELVEVLTRQTNL
ncbi:MAG: TolC family protein, partial [Chitinophagaceae bacterium]